ncbi:hypothetical protein [Oceanobacillus kapialis]
MELPTRSIALHYWLIGQLSWLIVLPTRSIEQLSWLIELPTRSIACTIG